jgi:hypothetical protein
VRKAAQMTRAAEKCSGLQVEDEENVPDCLADEAVVSWVKVPDTAAVVPDALFVKLKDALPEPPATSLSWASVSSITISMFYSPNLSWVEQGEEQLKGENALHAKPRSTMLIITRRERNREIWLILNPAAKEAAIEAKPANATPA